MTISEFALYRWATTVMTPEELERATALAKESDAGDPLAYIEFRRLICKVIGRKKAHERAVEKKL